MDKITRKEYLAIQMKIESEFVNLSEYIHEE